MRCCHGNRGVLFHKCQIVLLSSHFADNLVSLSRPPPSLTPPASGSSSSPSLAPSPPYLPSIQHPHPSPQGSSPDPHLLLTPLEKMARMIDSLPRFSQGPLLCLRPPGPALLWERCLPPPTPALCPPISGRQAATSRGFLECSGVILFC